jgi:hypothetical protein
MKSFEIFTTVIMKNVIWDVTPCGSCTVNVVPSSPILVTLMMEAIRSSGTSALTRASQRTFQQMADYMRSSVFLNLTW